MVRIGDQLSIFDGTDFIEEFRGETDAEKLENTAVFRTYRRKPKSLLVMDELARNIRLIEEEEIAATTQVHLIEFN